MIQYISKKDLWRASVPASNKAIKVRNPYNNELIGEVYETTREDLPALFARASAAFRNDTSLSYDRFTILNETAGLLARKKDEFAELVCRETGKPIRETRIEVDRAVTTLSWSAQEALRIEGIVQPCDVTGQRLAKTAYIHRVPLGLIAAVTPFNFPLNIPAHKVGPALASGNAVILKPSPRAPLATGELVKLFYQAGLPEDLLQVVQGGTDITRELVQGPINAVSFTGSTSAGREVSKWAFGKKMILELGGSDAVVVMDDANLEAAAEILTNHRFGSSGQRCTSSKRAFIHQSIYSEMKSLLIARISRLKTGDPMNEDTDIGPLIAKSCAENLARKIEGAVKKGAVVLTGGRKEGNFLFPTLIENVPPGDPLVCEETMGPVLPLMKFMDFSEAAEQVNNTAFGLQSSLFTNRMDIIQEAFRVFEVGALIVNDGTGFRVESLPFGGVKASGTGREGVRYAIEEYTTLKTLVI